MILTIAEDWSTSTELDAQLLATPDSGMYLNSGVHSAITVKNLLSFLPNVSITPATYDSSTTYGKYEDSRKRSDIVTYNGAIYQSIVSSNLNNTPDSSPTQWLQTDLNSLRIKNFVWQSQNKAIKNLNLTRRLVDSQYLYNVAELRENPEQTTLPNNYAAWVFEPKGSDYVKIRINQVALQAVNTGTYNIYVINQGQLIDTLTITTNTAGIMEFVNLDNQENGYEFYGKGKWIFAIDTTATDVYTNGSTIDPLKYDGFVAYTASGIGASAADAEWSFGTTNNGLNFNMTSFLDAEIYLDNNLRDFGSYLQASWEVDCLKLFLNPHSRSNREERIVGDKNLLIAESMELGLNSVAKKLKHQEKRAFEMLKKTLDRELSDDNNDFMVDITSV